MNIQGMRKGWLKRFILSCGPNSNVPIVLYNGFLPPSFVRSADCQEFQRCFGLADSIVKEANRIYNASNPDGYGSRLEWDESVDKAIYNLNYEEIDGEIVFSERLAKEQDERKCREQQCKN